MEEKENLPNEHIKTDDQNFGRCGVMCGFWPIFAVAIICIFALGFGLKACSAADDSAEVVEIAERTTLPSSSHY